METTDIVIHKGEKEKKYQLYVEDYVMSYLKNYASADGRKIFFYGTREQKNKKYYIYGAGQQKNISYFVRYELLDEIVCHFDMDTPVFSVKEDSKRYDLAGYYIFYQSNEAMQSYMIEQRKESESSQKAQGKFKPQNDMAHLNNIDQTKSMGQAKIRPQDFSDIRSRNRIKTDEERQEELANKNAGHNKTDARKGAKSSEKSKGGIMAFQLSAIFLILAAIIINSTNSYTKLHELGQSAVEVFFAMENQEASQKIDGEKFNTADDVEVSDESEGTILRLEDLDAELEKENQAAMQEETQDDAPDMKNESSNEVDINDAELNEINSNETSSNEVDSNETNSSESNSSESDSNESNENKENQDNIGENTNTPESSEQPDINNNNTPASQEAFARNLTEYYKIEKGDTLCNISIKKYGDASKVREICEINKIEDPDNIKYGQKIILP